MNRVHSPARPLTIVATDWVHARHQQPNPVWLTVVTITPAQIDAQPWGMLAARILARIRGALPATTVAPSRITRGGTTLTIACAGDTLTDGIQWSTLFFGFPLSKGSPSAKASKQRPNLC